MSFDYKREKSKHAFDAWVLILLCGICLLLVLIPYFPRPPEPTPTVRPSPTATLKPTATQPEPTVKPTDIPQPTPTDTPEPTATQKPKPTFTPLPTAEPTQVLKPCAWSCELDIWLCYPHIYHPCTKAK